MSDMTSAAAIDLLDNLIGMVDDNQENDYDSALHMAIDALKTQAERTEERTETHSCDLISRQVAIDALDHMDYMPGEWAVKGLTMCKEIIKGLPSAQPEIVRCKDCMYWVAHDKRCVYLNHGFAPNMWCCHGRRTDE